MLLGGDVWVCAKVAEAPDTLGVAEGCGKVDGAPRVKVEWKTLPAGPPGIASRGVCPLLAQRIDRGGIAIAAGSHEAMVE